jgi:hypothetical protein
MRFKRQGSLNAPAEASTACSRNNSGSGAKPLTTPEALLIYVVAVPPGGPANPGNDTMGARARTPRRATPRTLPSCRSIAELSRERRATTDQLSHVTQRSEAETRHLLTRKVERGWVEHVAKARNAVGTCQHQSTERWRSPPATSAREDSSPTSRNRWSCYTSTRTGRSQSASRGPVRPRTRIRPADLLRRLTSEGKLANHGERRW